MGYFRCVGSRHSFREIGVGAGDMELASEYAASQGVLVPADPPVAQAVYVCGWCFRVVERGDLNHADELSGRAVCDACAEAKKNNS